MNRIDVSFNKVKENNEKALIPFVTCGADFTVEETADLIIQLEKEGATVVEIGIPFRDPLADGPVIQNAYTKALANGTKVKDIFRCVELIREKSEVPVVLMVYFNVIYFKGLENFIKDAAKSGVDGLIVPDVPLEERGEINEICEANGIYLIPLVARTSKDRIAAITKDAKGFVYCVSTNGTTGERTTLDSGTHEYLDEVRKIVDIPMCIGFGISSKEVVKEVKDYCDGVIVGSAIVKRMAEGKQAVIEFVKDLKEGFK
jgi:tryptophan synthase alpha chain